MKFFQLWLLPALFLISFRSTAQVTDFAPLGAKWYYSEIQWIPVPPVKTYPNIVEVVSKEMYQGKLCSKLVNTSIITGPSATFPHPLYVYTQNDSVMFYSDFSGQFELLYNFGAQAGESWIIGGLNTTIGVDTLTVYVDSVGQWMIGGDTLKVQFVSYRPFYDWGFEIIEGVGNTGFLLPDFGLYEGGPAGLRCYQDPNNDYHFVTYPCDTVNGTSSTANIDSEVQISVFPNPVTANIHISISPNLVNCSFALWDPLGRLVRERVAMAGGTNKIDTYGLQPGVYLWQVWQENKPLIKGQIVITPK